MRACTSSPAKQIPPDASTLPSPFDAATSPLHTKHGSVDTYTSPAAKTPPIPSNRPGHR